MSFEEGLVSRMTKNSEYNAYLDALERDHANRPYVGVMIPKSKPWIKQYFWITDASMSGPAKEEPSDGDRAFVAVRNSAISAVEVKFDCRTRNGKVLFLEASPIEESNVFQETLLGTPKIKEGAEVPVIESSPIECSEIPAMHEIVSVSTRVLDRFSKKQISESYVDATLRF